MTHTEPDRTDGATHPLPAPESAWNDPRGVALRLEEPVATIVVQEGSLVLSTAKRNEESELIPQVTLLIQGPASLPAKALVRIVFQAEGGRGVSLLRRLGAPLQVDKGFETQCPITEGGRGGFRTNLRAWVVQHENTLTGELPSIAPAELTPSHAVRPGPRADGSQEWTPGS